MTYRSVENIKIGKNSFGQNRDNASLKVNFSFYYIWFLYPFKSIQHWKIEKSYSKRIEVFIKKQDIKELYTFGILACLCNKSYNIHSRLKC